MASSFLTKNILIYNPLFPVHTLQRAGNYYSSAPISATSTNSQITTKKFSGFGSVNRRFPGIICSASSEKPSQITQTRTPAERTSGSHQQLLHHFSLRMVLEIITFIWRLPGIITGFLKKEEKFLDTVEEDINKAADAIQVTAKVIVEVAEGLEKVAKTIENDAERVDAIMDEVKEKTKLAHDELEEVVGSLEGSMQDVKKNVEKLPARENGSKEDATDTPTTIIPPSPRATTTSSFVMIENLLHHGPFQDITAVRGFLFQCSHALHGVLSSIQLHLFHVKFEPLFYLSSLPRGFVGALIMVSFFCVLGATTTAPLIPIFLSTS
eukprot:c11382_g1_i1 orf=194-1165(+)